MKKYGILKSYHNRIYDEGKTMIVNHTINKVINNTEKNTESLLDLTADSVSPENLLLNKTAHNSEGEGIVGEMPEGGTNDYNALNNLPQINGNLLKGNKTGGQLGLQNRVLASTLNIGGQIIGNVEEALSALNESKSDLVNGKVPVNELPVYQPVIGSIQSIGGIVPPSSSGDEDKYLRSDGTWAKPEGGGGGVTDYDDLTNRPKVNGTTLSEDKTGTQLGLQNIVLSSALSIGGQTVTEVEEALQALNEKIGGTDDYLDLQNKPKVNGNTLVGNKTGSQLGLQNTVLASALTIGGQTITEVEPALRALNEKGGGHIIVDEEGTTYPARANLKFVNCTVTDDSTNDTTIIEAEGGGGVKKYTKPVITVGTYTYDGTTQAPTITGFDANVMTLTGTYEATNAGSYTFTIALSDKTSSKWTDDTQDDIVINWSIGKANSNTTASTSSISLNTSNTSRTVTLSNVTGTVTVSSSNTSVATASVSNNTVTISGVNHKDGSATITISIAASTNYKAKTLTVSVSASYKSTITVTLYSAASDTVSFTDDAGSKTAVTDTSGKKTSVSIVIPYNGKTITFTSSVAKNPSNLSNAYSKSIALTRSTSEIKVMPDGALYWYGNKCEWLTGGWENPGSYRYNVYSVSGTVAFNTNKITIDQPTTDQNINMVGTTNSLTPGTYSTIKQISKYSNGNDMSPITYSNSLSGFSSFYVACWFLHYNKSDNTTGGRDGWGIDSADKKTCQYNWN